MPLQKAVLWVRLLVITLVAVVHAHLVTEFAGGDEDVLPKAKLLVDVVLDELSLSNFNAAVAAVNKLDSTIKLSTTPDQLEVARYKEVIVELRALLAKANFNKQRVQEFSEYYINARVAQEKLISGAALHHARRARLLLESLDVEATAIRANLMAIEVCAAIYLATPDIDGALENDLVELTKRRWGDASREYAGAIVYRAQQRLLADSDSDVLPDLKLAGGIFANHDGLCSIDYLSCIENVAARLIDEEKYSEADTLCTTAIVAAEELSDSRAMDIAERVVPLFRSRATARTLLSTNLSTVADFDSSERAAFGRYTFPRSVELTYKAYTLQLLRANVAIPKYFEPWMVRLSLATSAAKVDFRWSIGCWIDSGLLTADEYRSFSDHQSATAAIRAHFARSQFAAANIALLELAADVRRRRSDDIPDFPIDWLAPDVAVLAKSDRDADSQTCRRAVSFSWRIYENDASRRDAEPPPAAASTAAIVRKLGKNSATGWFFERALAKALRERGRFAAAAEHLRNAREILTGAGRLKSVLGVIQTTEELVLAALRGDAARDPAPFVLAFEINLPRTIAYLPLRAQQTQALGMYALVGETYQAVERLADSGNCVNLHRELHEYAGPDFTLPLSQALKAAAYGHYGETERAEKEFAAMKLALEGGEGIRAPELRWFALKQYADFLDKIGKPARAKKIRQLAEAELPDRDKE